MKIHLFIHRHSFVSWGSAGDDQLSGMLSHALFSSLFSHQDVLGAAADIIAGQRAGAGREKLCALRLELDALCLFANGVAHRVSKHVYQRLSEVVAAFA